jgi:hypothetical protein
MGQKGDCQIPQNPKRNKRPSFSKEVMTRRKIHQFTLSVKEKYLFLPQSLKVHGY